MVIKYPCDECVHKNVCGIRDSLPEIDKKSTDLQSLQISPYISMSVNCSARNDGTYLSRK